MKITKINENTAKYTFTVTKEEFQHAVEHAYDSIKENVEIDGFRKGHAPLNKYINKYGVESLYEDALNHVFSHKFQEVVDDDTHRISGNPDVDLDHEKIDREKGFEFSFLCPIHPEVELGKYKELEVDSVKIEVTEEEIETYIEEQLQKNESLVLKDEKEKLEENDTAIFDFKGMKDGVAFEGGTAENYELKIGSGQFIPGFEEQMIGMLPGEEKTIDLTFPEDYHEKSLAGAPVQFIVKLHEVKVTERPELDDEFVRNLQIEEVETVEQYKKHVKKQLKEAKEREEKSRVMQELLQQAQENAKMNNHPKAIELGKERILNNIAQQMAQYGINLDMYIQFSGKSKEEFMSDVEEQAERQLRELLTLEAIVDQEKLEIDEKELKEAYEKMAKHYNMAPAEIKKHVPEDHLREDMKLQKAFDLIYDSAKINIK